MSAADATTQKPSLADWMSKKTGGANLSTASKSVAASVAANATAKTAAKSTNEDDEPFFMPSSEIDREWDLGVFLVRITEAENYTAESSGNKSFKVHYLGLTGTMKGAGLDDYWPKAGKGLRKTHKAASAVDLTDAEGNISIPGGAQQLVGRELWIEIERVTETYRDKETGEQKSRPRNKIAFTGYYHKSEFDVPADGDLFSEGQPLPAETKAPALTAAEGEIVGVEPGTDDAPTFE